MRHSVGFCAAALALLAACRAPPAAPRPEPEGPIRAASLDLLAAEIGRAGALAAVEGRLALALREDARAAPRTCKAVLVARSPSSAAGPGLYVKGYRGLVPTLFTLVSDGRTFWLHVPHDGIVYAGRVAGGAAGDREVPLDACDLFRAL
ncbi:MAG TPA: hypothetical protein VD838_09070, partial [Anaeromyxobacteraceae bacterium]|nr:hypothetical protein [Anaeromyxobacteraceae bacterium]